MAHVLNAQTSKGSLLVKVVDQLGDAVVDAEITLLKSEQKDRQIKTDRRGVAQFSNLINGKYQVVVSATGFKEYKSELITTQNGGSKTIEVNLEIASVESKVEVGGDDVADTDRFGATRILNQSEIDKLPDDSQDFERALRQLAGPSLSGEAMPITVDGFTNGQIPPKEAIRQIRINQNIFSAQYEGQYGGGIEIFTKSDIKKFSGFVGFNFADSHLDAANPYIGARIPAQTRNYRLSLFGPLVRKKAPFTFSIARNESDTGSPINALVLDSSFNPVPYRRFSASPRRAETVFLSVKADPTKKHNLVFNYSLNNSRSRGQGISDFSLPSRAYNADSRIQTIQLSDTYLANENVVSQTRFQLSSTNNQIFGGSNEAAINVLDAFSGGGSQVNSSSRNLRAEFSSDTTWQMGNYGLSFGGRIRVQSIKQISESNFGGTYTFSGRLAPVLDVNNNPVADGNGSFVTAQINSLESYRRTRLFQSFGYSNAQIRALGGGASQFSIFGGNPEVLAKQYDIALYVQNSYKLSKTVAASFGVRYENQTNINSNFNFAPRFGIVWSPKADKKKSPLYALPRISAGFGVFYNRFGINNLLSVRQVGDASRLQYLLTDASILDFYPNVPSTSLLEQFALPSINRLIDSDIHTPLDTLFNVNISKKLPSDFSLTLTYSHAKGFRQSLTRNVNAPLAGTFDLQNPVAIYPLGRAEGQTYRTFSGGKRESDWINLNLGIPSLKYLETQFSYSFFKGKNDLVAGSGSPFDAYDFSREFSRAENDGQHRISISTVSNKLPFGISIVNFFNFATGSRFNIITGRDTNGDGFYSERPAFATDLSKPNLIVTKYGILDPNPSPTDTIIPRNLGRGPATFNLDTIFDKNFKLGVDKNNPKKGGYNLNLSVYIRNALNTNNKGNPIGNISSPNFLRQIGYSSDASYVFANSAGTFSGFSGRSFNFSIGFGF